MREGEGRNEVLSKVLGGHLILHVRYPLLQVLHCMQELLVLTGLLQLLPTVMSPDEEI